LSDADKLDIAGPCFKGFAELPADDTRGSVLLFWKNDLLIAKSVTTQNHSITVTFDDLVSNLSWTLTMVYGPSDEERKLQFLSELSSIHGVVQGPWMVIGDFNLILHDQDKNKPRVNRTWMRHFKAALDANFLPEIKLVGRRYRWSNE
jgi:hypothetical protein